VRCLLVATHVKRQGPRVEKASMPLMGRSWEFVRLASRGGGE